MDIKQEIGSRIAQTRKQLGITIKELSERTKSLSAARISNYEQGTRSPGPMEAKAIANALEISASYLLCLSDDPRGEVSLQSTLMPRYVPVLPIEEANITKSKLQGLVKNLTVFSEEAERITLDDKTKMIAGNNTFAIRVNDSSMHPIFIEGDIVVVDPDRKPNPGQFVIAHTQINNQKQNILRKFREGNNEQGKVCFELIPLHQDWRTLIINDTKEGCILGTVIEHRRFL